MEKRMFEDIKVGDRVWSYIHQQWFTVTEVDQNRFGANDGGSDFTYWITKEGTHIGFKGEAPTWFWNEVPLIVPPPKPKRMVQKMRRIFVNLYPECTHYAVNAVCHDTRDKAVECAANRCIAVAVPVDVPYEEEEK